MTTRRVFRAAIFALSTTALVGCQTTGGGGGGGTPQTSAVRSVQEQQVGDSNHEKLVAQFGGKYNNARVSNYVNELGQRIARVSEQPGERWTFTVLDTPTVNAFAIPGGYVYVTRGLVALADDEAELAGVIGHEIGHVAAGHSSLRQERSGIAGIGLLLGAIGLSVLGADPGVTRGALQLGQMAAGGILADYSRSDELAADNLGIRYLARAGYDPYAQADFLDSLAANSETEARAAGKSYNREQADFLATHPATGPRTRQAIEIAQSQGDIGGSVGADRGRDRFLSVIDGMTWGPSPDQGFVEGTTFSHPKLGFTFTAPAGYRMTNMPQAVVADGSGGTRLVFDGAQDPGGSLTSYISGQWARAIAQQTRTGQLRNLETVRIGGASAARAVLPVAINNKAYDALLVAVRFQGKLYRFMGLAPQGSRELSTLARATETFRGLTRAERNSMQAKRIDIVTVRSGDTVASLARRMNVDTMAEERFRVLNSIGRGDRLRAGQKVKIIR